MDFLLEKMDPMARRAKAAVAEIEKAIAEKDMSSVIAHIVAAENALQMLKSDATLHSQLVQKSDISPTPAADRFLGVIPQYQNTDVQFTGLEGETPLGFSRHGRSNRHFTPHRVV